MTEPVHLHLLLLGSAATDVPTGFRSVERVDPSPTALAARLADLERDPADDAIVVWDPARPLPPVAAVGALLRGPADVWHAGRALGLLGQPAALDFVQPTWMLACEGDDDVAGTSWRLSVGGCVVRRRTLRAMAAPDPSFATVAGMGLDWGLSMLRAGAVVRYAPELATGGPVGPVDVPHRDQIRLVRRQFGRSWAAWAFLRSAPGRLIGDAAELAPSAAIAFGRATGPAPTLPAGRAPSTPTPEPNRAGGAPVSDLETVTVLIPTIERYPYLETVLGQLVGQTVAPHQVVIVDQTPSADRRRDWPDRFPTLPICYLELESAGQCSSRNAGLQRATGSHILFLDDDDEIGPTVIDDHLRFLRRTGADASCGIVTELDGDGGDVTDIVRVSEVFPTNNAMLVRSCLERSGLFDRRFDRGPRADHDLGMRLHLSGALLMQNPDAHVIHHHAPRGGLRHHGARQTTKTNTVATLVRRNLRASTDAYLARRYFSRRQVREAAVINVLVTLRGSGPRHRRIARAVVQLVLLPSTIATVRRAEREGERAYELGPSIDQAGWIGGDAGAAVAEVAPGAARGGADGSARR